MNKILVAGALSAFVLASAPVAAEDGKAVYEQACHVCHAAGVAGAPKLGDKVAWTDRIAQSIDTLHQHALNGFTGKTGVMPPKGGFTHLTDEQVMAAVDYMVSQAR